MTVRFLKLLSLLGGLLAFTVAVNAQSEVVTVHVPFAFVAGGKTLPAGDYRVDKGEAPNVLIIQGRDDNSSTSILAIVSDTSTPNSKDALVFARHGSALFLSAVRVSGNQTMVVPDLKSQHAALKSATLASPILK